MGYRTTVILFNDQADEWQNDPELGKKIMRAAMDREMLEGRVGRVIECDHADVQRVFVIDSYNGDSVATSLWSRTETTEQRDVKLLREWADRLGYTIRKK